MDQKGGMLKHAALQSSHGARATHGVEYAVLSGVVACLLVLGASVFGSDLADLFTDASVVAVQHRPGSSGRNDKTAEH